MDHSSSMERILAYIDSHLDDNLTVEQLARYSDYSFYHFCHAFSSYTGIPAATYLRRRRMELAAKDLLAGRKSADVAAARGFDTSSGFAKAFRRHYGLSPTQYRREMGDARFCVTPSIRPMGPFTAVGYRLAPPNGEFDVLDAGAYWMGKTFSFVSKADYRRLAGPDPMEIGAWIQPDRETGAFFYFFGPVVERTDFIPQGLAPVQFEAAEYAVFPVPAGNGNMTLLNENVRRMWKYIFQEWLPGNGRYRAAGGRMDFECYHGGETSICIPVIAL